MTHQHEEETQMGIVWGFPSDEIREDSNVLRRVILEMMKLTGYSWFRHFRPSLANRASASVGPHVPAA